MKIMIRVRSATAIFLIFSTPALAISAEDSIAESDDFSTHRKAFIAAATKLIGDRTCSAAELSEQGGFWKSQNHKSRPIYFTYCGGDRIANRIYLNVNTGQISK